MTYQLLNEHYVPARNLKTTNIRNVFFFFMFIFDISFNIGIYKIVPPASCLATLYPELPLIVWFTLNRIFTPSAMATKRLKISVSSVQATTPVFKCIRLEQRFLKSMVFSAGIRRFKVGGVVYSYKTI